VGGGELTIVNATPDPTIPGEVERDERVRDEDTKSRSAMLAVFHAHHQHYIHLAYIMHHYHHDHVLLHHVPGKGNPFAKGQARWGGGVAMVL
jgi:hypothetical protein